jgi:NitT/TauT family transport system substrate-binding protein
MSPTRSPLKLRPLGLAAALVLSATGATAQDKLTLQLKWVTQAQFAGYYVAKDKGFYEERTST